MKNKKLILKFQIFSAIFVIVLGTILHFTYEWSNGNKLVGVFSAVNESIWEHLKLLFFPMLITIIIGYFYIGKTSMNFLCAKTIGIITSILFTIISFYTYTGVIGTNIDVLNISIFVLAVLIGEYVAYKILISNFLCNKKLAIVVLVILLLCFIIFTFATPKINLFKGPINNEYGINV